MKNKEIGYDTHVCQGIRIMIMRGVFYEKKSF